MYSFDAYHLGAKAVFLFEKDVEETNNGQNIGGKLDVKINLNVVKIHASAQFETINNETKKDTKLRVKFHGDYLIGNK